MKTNRKRLVMVTFLVSVFLACFVAANPSDIGLVKNAEAIIGLPFTPLSFAGVARRTAYRSVAYSSAAAATAVAASAAAAAAAPVYVAPASGTAVPVGTIIHALPAGCASVAISGVQYFNCAGVYYKVAFQSDNVVYVVVPAP